MLTGWTQVTLYLEGIVSVNTGAKPPVCTPESEMDIREESELTIVAQPSRKDGEGKQERCFSGACFVSASR